MLYLLSKGMSYGQKREAVSFKSFAFTIPPEFFPELLNTSYRAISAQEPLVEDVQVGQHKDEEQQLDLFGGLHADMVVGIIALVITGFE